MNTNTPNPTGLDAMQAGQGARNVSLRCGKHW